MGLIGGLGWISVGKKQCRSLYWRIRAEMKKAVRIRRSKQKQVMNFQYDPHSYSLNFDDGFHQETRDFRQPPNIQVVGSCQESTAVWIYVVYAE
ncbi:hypothetical protein OROMI_023659 [Orobanche minor]